MPKIMKSHASLLLARVCLQIKWLKEITVEAQESQNYYHFFDNRVLPSHVDQEIATAEGG